ncbi:S-adenosyl-L-methionine-dependent methyltransferase [Endogone sp. FLAS-F59071]|nr:S-adenosyl-L-methionine-dependent methyltransferase [Endogone sp. FLAS-F59071]|eukprot:RUS12808.1 S-adenosyl-L-methionine-dependent methyltransferase [Endogone sp. FLAS-F59071]
MTETASKRNAEPLTEEFSRRSSQLSCMSSEPELSEGFKVIKDRKYGSSTDYMLPVDDEGINRMDLQHYICRQLCHGNFNAPIDDALESGIRVLDIGCGGGCWTIEMAQDFKNSIFVGIDAAPVFPTDESHYIPANASFISADVLCGLPFENDTFDYVFCRFMMAAFSPVNWQVAVKEMKRVLKPGGCLELFEMSMDMVRASRSCMKAEGPCE